MSCELPIPCGQDRFTLLEETNREWFHVFCTKKRAGRVDEYTFSEGWGNARFSPISQADGSPVGTYYMASTAECAYMESVLHDVPLSPAGQFDIDELRYYFLVRLTLQTNLHCVSFHSPYLPKLQLTRTQLIESLPPCYPKTRAWAQAAYLQMPNAQALSYGSRRNDMGRCLMLFRQRLSNRSLEPDFTVQEVVNLASDSYRRDEILHLMSDLTINIV